MTNKVKSLTYVVDGDMDRLKVVYANGDTHLMETDQQGTTADALQDLTDGHFDRLDLYSNPDSVSDVAQWDESYPSAVVIYNAE